MGLLRASALVGSRVQHTPARARLASAVADHERQDRTPGPHAHRPPPRSPSLATRRALSQPPPPRPFPPIPRHPPPFCSQLGELARRPPASPTACLRPSAPPRATGPVVLSVAACARAGATALRPRGSRRLRPPTPRLPPYPARRVRTRHGQPRLARGTATRPSDTCAPALGRAAPPPRPAPPPSYSPRPRPRGRAHTLREGCGGGTEG